MEFALNILSDSPPDLDRSPLQANGPGGARRQARLSGQRVKNAWLWLVRWLRANTFAPRWLPERLRRPLVGYLIALLIEVVAVGLTVFIVSVFPEFVFHGILMVVGVVLVALSWGAGPSLFATLLGTLLLYFFALPPQFTWSIGEPADSMGVALHLVVGVSISLIASRSERARRGAEDTARLLARAQARSELENQRLHTTLEVLPSAVVIADSQGQLLEVNQAAKGLWGEQAPLAAEDWALARALSKGEVALNEELEIETFDGQRKAILHSAAPIRDASGAIIGAVSNAQDISEVRRLEQRTRDALSALVAMGEAMVQEQPRVDQIELAGSAAPAALRRLAELTRSVLASRRVSVAAIEAQTGLLHPVTVVGLAPEQEQAWWATWSPPQRIEGRYDADIAAALAAGEPVLLDRAHLPERCWHYLHQAQSGLALPMRVGEELVGILFVDYGDLRHDYTAEEEVVLTRAISRLGALVLERDRLLRRWAEARANELALRETQEHMDTFLGVAGHELKNPLAAVQLGVQLSQRRLKRLARSRAEESPELEPVLKTLEQAEQQTRFLERWMNDILDVTRVRAGKLTLRPATTDLAAIVRQSVEAQRRAAPNRALLLEADPAEPPLTVYADADRIGQVVTNFLTNALKYSPADQPVEIGIALEGQQARVWVRDEGPGLPPEEHERVWERFHRARGIEVQSGSGIGLGLGLYLCRTIIEQHQGQVGVQSAPGKGSTFWFVLPLAVSVSHPPLEPSAAT